MSSVRNLATTKNTKAFSMYQELQKALKEQARLFLYIGNTLRIIRDEKLYRHLGEGGFDDFKAFLNNPEIGMRPSTAYLYIRIYEYYSQRLLLPEDDILAVPINRLMRLLPHLKKMDDEKAKQTITEVGGLTNYDYDVELKARNLQEPRPLLYVSKDSGKWIVEGKKEQFEAIFVDSVNVLYAGDEHNR